MDYGFLKMDCRFLKMDYGFVKMDYGLVKWIRGLAKNKFEVLRMMSTCQVHNTYLKFSFGENP